MPAVNVVDNECNYEIEIAAPGFDKNDFKVMVENGILNILAETSQEEEEKNKNYTRKEFSKRSFRRSFTLPENVKDEEVSAKYADGVLRLFLDKTEIEPVLKREIAVD
jgi:HSP20 family protein